MLPSSFQKVFQKYDISTHHEKLKEKDKLEWLKKTIKATEKPVILLIAHGYNEK